MTLPEIQAGGATWTLFEAAAVAAGAGSAAQRLLDVRSSPLLQSLVCGVGGLYVGSLVWEIEGWNPGPMVGGFGIVPAVAGALAVTSLVKLLCLVACVPRR